MTEAQGKIARLLQIQRELDQMGEAARSSQDVNRRDELNRLMSELRAEREKLEEEPGGDEGMIPSPK